MARQPSIGDVVICWGVGFDKRGEAGIILEIDHSKKYPYRIYRECGNSNSSLWCDDNDFKFADASKPPSAHYTDVSQLAQWRKENS